MSRVYFVHDGDEMVRRRARVPRGSVVEAWADMAIGGGTFWVGEESKGLLDAAGEAPMPPRLVLPAEIVPIFYGPRLSDLESLPREESLRARVLSAHGVAVAMVRIAAAPLWGRTVDRLGGRPVLQVCSVGVAFVPAIWLFATPDRLWPLAIEAVVAGTLWGGHGIAAMDLTLGLSPRRQRAFYVAVFAAAGGLGFAVASVLAGALAWRLPSELPLLGLTWTSLHALFFLSSLGRAAAAVLAWRIAERDARPAGDVLRALPGEITRLLGSPVGARRSWRRPSHTAAG